uniref:Carboxylic ester hydrolase n=3 Tax=Clastoptera arizonana TaxID=38151 RepID=A0A1B6C6S0_9HEMI
MDDFKTVQISQGYLKGKVSSSYMYGYDFVSFKGIPYAKPPVGELRFKPPQPHQGWEGVREALREGSVAPHFDMFTKLFVGNEDCLFLNVYTTKINFDKITPLKPVMVYIHGGGFAFGHGNSDVYGPEYLLQHNIVLVTFNYRLGVLGFLNLECQEAPGNVGLKDQVLALKWVKNEIEKFGGDSENVTLFGESAGGACVHLHMLSDMSKGLFHKAIAQSGNALCNWAFTSCHKKRAFNLAHILGKNPKNIVELMEFFNTVPPENFAEHQDSAICSKTGLYQTIQSEICNHNFLEVEGIDQAFVPSVERNVVEEIFLSDTPFNLMKSGKMSDIPFITGITANEGLYILNSILKYPMFLNRFCEKLSNNELIPDEVNLLESKEKISAAIKEFYFKEKNTTLEMCSQEIFDFYTDFSFLLPMVRMITMFKKTCNSPLFCYEFQFDGPLAWYKHLMAENRKITYIPKGVCHADELGYIFSNAVTTKKLENINTYPDSRVVVTNTTQLWTNFAKTGNPTSNGFDVSWSPVTSSEKIINMGIDLDLKPDEVLGNNRLGFWKSFFQPTDSS